MAKYLDLADAGHVAPIEQPDAGHVAPIEQPDAFSAPVRAFSMEAFGRKG